jgi:hypothetical protein
MEARKRFGIAWLVAAIFVALEYLQNASFMHKLLGDIGLTGLLKWLLPPWLGPVVTIFSLVFLALWAFEPLLRSSGALESVMDAWLARKRLRMTTFIVAKRMRRFADATLADYDTGATDRNQDNYLMRFWRRFPYKSYQYLQDRMQVKVYGGVRPHISKFMPSSPEVVKQLADCLEQQALELPADMLL